jgi:hypothetical protein
MIARISRTNNKANFFVIRLPPVGVVLGVMLAVCPGHREKSL